MGFSIQTNVNAMIGQENLRLNQDFQSRTINRLTSGYRLNSSADDAAGLSVANKYRSDVTSLMQGVRNANDGISSLQIIDGGLNNISKILDRMTTLATQSATDTFEGDRTILQNEYNSLITEINRQAANVGLGRGSEHASRYNINISTFIGGGGSQTSNSKVGVDLGTGNDRVDAQTLKLSATSIVGGGVNKSLTTNSVSDLDSGSFLSGETQAFTINTASGTFTATIGDNGSGMSGTAAVEQLNNQIASLGITASVTDDGELQFSGGSTAFTIDAGTATDGIASATATWANNTLYRVEGQTTFANVAGNDIDVDISLNDGASTVPTITLATGTTIDQAKAQLNSALNSYGVYAVTNAAGTGLDFQSTHKMQVSTSSAAANATGVFGTNDVAGTTQALTDPDASANKTGNALKALEALSGAVTQLSGVQGKVGTGLNKLQYAIQLAQSQIANFSAAESRIRDADVAQEAANLTKAQVLQQASMAAMAQANSAPQAVISLLRG